MTRSQTPPLQCLALHTRMAAGSTPLSLFLHYRICNASLISTLLCAIVTTCIVLHGNKIHGSCPIDSWSATQEKPRKKKKTNWHSPLSSKPHPISSSVGVVHRPASVDQAGPARSSGGLLVGLVSYRRYDSIRRSFSYFFFSPAPSSSSFSLLLASFSTMLI